MKTILIAILTLAFSANAFSAERLEPTNWRNVQTFDVPALLEKEAAMLYRVVGVRFNYRSEKLRHLQPNWYEASLWQRDPKAKRGFSAVRVMVAKQDLPAFKSITSDFRSGPELTAYGRVERDPNAYFLYVRLLGRKVVMDAAGNPTVEW